MATGILNMNGCALASATEAPERHGKDFALVRRVQAGDEMAFRELVESCQARVYRLIGAIVRRSGEAEEVAQEVFVKVYFGIRRFDFRSSLFTWIHRIAANEAYAHLRKNRARFACEAHCAADAAAPDPRALADARPTADRALAARDLLHKLLARIPEDDRVLLLLKEAEGLSIARLSELTGFNESTVKVKLFRTRKRLAGLAARLSHRRILPAASVKPDHKEEQ
jgi:RNA polymerase sigma-70 factor (ECF subfamily)